MEKVKADKRNTYGRIAGLVGIIVNLLLAAGKIALGAICGIISVLADGLNNLTDCGSSVISTVSFKLAAKPADKEHPFGHERIEYICSLAVAVIILLVAFETAKESIAKIISPTAIDFSYWTLGILFASILAKFGLFFYYKLTAKKIDSDILRATAVDSLTDCISTTVVLITIIIGKFTSVNIDGYAGVLVALFIAFSAIGILKDILSKLIGQSADGQTLLEIKERILAHPEVLGVHDLSVYSYGPNKYFASAHIEVDAKVDVLASHELVDAIEREFIQETNVVLTGHLDPIVTDDERVNELRKKVEGFVREIDQSFTVHDFRMVCGEKRTNVLFDVAVPYGTTIAKEYIKQELERRLMAIDEKYCLIITVEHTVL
ncbi:MAG: cation transporter [Clostridia bacterium]|nr:cation transporter [Clostridia bacterium]